MVALLLSFFFNAAPLYELQWRVCDLQPEHRAAQLGFVHEEERQVYYGEVDSFALFQQGVVLRIRETGAKQEIAWKVRRSVSESYPSHWNTRKGFKCEHDWHGEEEKFVCSWKEEIKFSPYEKFSLSKRQKEFLLDFAPSTEALWDQIKIYGPARQSVWEKKEPGRVLAWEVFSIGSQVFTEFSFRSGEKNMDISWGQEFLRKHLVSLCENQGSTTKEKLLLLGVSP